MSSVFANPPGKLPVDIAKLGKRLYRQAGEAIRDFDMIGPGDRVMVCVSGGKDSHALLDILLGIRERSPKPFGIVAVNLDQKQPGFPARGASRLPEGPRRRVPHRRAGHLLRRQAPHSRGPDDVQPVFAPAARRALPRRRRTRRDPHRARPPP